MRRPNLLALLLQVAWVFLPVQRSFAFAARSPAAAAACSSSIKDDDPRVKGPSSGWFDNFVNRGSGSPRSSMAWSSYELMRSKLEHEPHDPRLQLEAAEALLKWVRHTTNGNFPRASSGKVNSGDNKTSRKIWKEHAPEALRLLKGGAAYAHKSGAYNMAKYHFLHAEAATYLSSSKGILRAALQADAMTFKRNVKPLLDHHPKYQGGVGHTFMGAFHLAAPWPVHDLSKAKDHFDAALKIDSRSRRNHYCRGLVALEEGDNSMARTSFEKAVKCKPTSPEEEDVGDFFLRESRGALKALSRTEGTPNTPGGGVGGRVVVAARLIDDW